MDFTSALSDLLKCLCGLASLPLGYIFHWKDNVKSLQGHTKDLNNVKEVVERTVRRVGVSNVSNENWLRKAQDVSPEADRVLQEVREHDRIKCLDYCLPQNCWAGYRLAKRVSQILNEVRELNEEINQNTYPVAPPPTLKMMSMDETVGLDNSLKEVWKWLVVKKNIGVIGLYGTGGVGKTTLMQRINRALLDVDHDFEIVIWVVVSPQVNEDNIRDDIRKRLDIKNEIWERWSQHERVHYLLEALTRKRFVLLIDDVWMKLDLSKIGVPHSNLKNGSKVVFTTRSETVCHQMRADKAYEVQCLTPKEALRLFKDNVGKSTLHSNPEISKLAKYIVLECKGLPLALVTVGRAMVGKDNPSEWRHALTTLRNIPHKLLGMVEEVYHVLKFSYDRLGDTTRQVCFLYCCRFPKSYSIIPDDLIELWIGEGLLGDTDDVYHKRDEGASILGDLKRACLLKSGLNSDEQPIVEMHDVIRDMATWIARDHGQRENKLLVIENEEDMSAKMISKWGEAEKVSLWGSSIANINRTPPMCSQLETLFVRETEVRLVSVGFFKSMMTCLKVLDLSGNKNIQSLLEGICDLISLQYLNLSGTCINELPREIKNLTRLRWLLFNNSMLDGIVLIPMGAIASLPLNVFGMWRTHLEKEEEVVEKLGDMQDLTDLSITVQKSFSAQKIFQSLQRCLRRVLIENCEDLKCIPISHSLEGSGNFLHLKVLYLKNCPMLEKMEITQGIGGACNCSCFPNLVDVSVSNCGFLDLSWLVHAPKLQKLFIESCPLMKKIIGDGSIREEVEVGDGSIREEVEVGDGSDDGSDESIREEVGDGSNDGSDGSDDGSDESIREEVGDGSNDGSDESIREEVGDGSNDGSDESIGEEVGDGFDGSIRAEVAASRLFSHLEILHIINLPSLRSICDHTLLFPQGKKFWIRGCRGLGKLPLDLNSARGSFSITGENSWWDQFEGSSAALVTLDTFDGSPTEGILFKVARDIIKECECSLATIKFPPSGAA